MKALLYRRLNYFKKTIPYTTHIWQYLSAVKYNIVCNYQIGDTYHHLVKLVQQSYHQI